MFLGVPRKVAQAKPQAKGRFLLYRPFLSLRYYQLCPSCVFPFADEMHVPVSDPGCGRSYVVGMVFLVDVEQYLVGKGVDVLLAETYVLFSVVPMQISGSVGRNYSSECCYLALLLSSRRHFISGPPNFP